jgi:hypothetical protein
LGRPALPPEQKTVEEPDDSALVLPGPLADRRGVFPLGQPPEPDAAVHPLGPDGVELVFPAEPVPGRDQQDSVGRLADKVARRPDVGSA